MGTSKYIKPTESELEILRILWERNKASVRNVHEELSKSKEAGYTTTLKLMQIMFEKGLVRRDDSMKIHVYYPVVSREKTQKQLLGKMITNLFGGSPTELVIHALGNHKASPEELEEIQKLLNNLKKQ
jgi:BlaI family transcriptional regulator, penicillinase repressor